MALEQIQVGEQTSGDGSIVTARAGRTGETMVSQTHQFHYEQAYRNRMGFSTTLLRATSVAATAQIGNIVRNPVGSGVNLVLGKWSIGVVATSATCTGFTLGYTYQATDPTGLTVADAAGLTKFSAGTTATTAFAPSLGKGYALATLLVAPLPFAWLCHNTAAIAVTGVDQLWGDLQGAFVVPPGGIVAICATGAAAAASSVNSTLVWEEVPI